MIGFILRRLSHAAIIVLGVLTISFVLLHVVPGDPASMYIRPEINPNTVVAIRKQFGLDEPVAVQYLHWLKGFLTFQFGVSFTHLQPVGTVIRTALGNTLQLTLAVFVVQMLIGSLLGLIAARWENSWKDHLIQTLLLIIYSVPGFWLGLLAIVVFSLKLGWLPSGQMQSIDASGSAIAMAWDRLRHMILPVSILVMPFIAYTARFMREQVLEVLQQRYIHTAIAYGLPERFVFFRYVLKNALLPQVTLLGLYIPFLFGGAVVIEQIFAWPGMGSLTVAAIFAHDYPLIMASTFIAALTVVIGNLCSDLLYLAVDPRLRHQSVL